MRFEAIVHNTKELKCRRGIDMFGEIVTRLAGMAERFCTALDCVDIGFLPDHTLDELPTASQIGATRVGGAQGETAAGRRRAPHRPAGREDVRADSGDDPARRVRRSAGQRDRRDPR